jgi:chorismate dehydratase
MNRFTVGCVPYVNAIPLVEMFEEMGEASPVQIVYKVPSELPGLLESGQAQAILVSSIDALRTPNRTLAEGVCIGSRDRVKSVRLFSKVPFEDIKTLAWDASSMTSNRLAMILLGEKYGVHPETVVMSPDMRAMLEQADACVLIGDIGMMSDGTGLEIMDLGEAWRNLTGKPFVWAAWIGGEDLQPDLVWWLQRAAACAGTEREGEPDYIKRNRETMVARAMQKANWPGETARDYFENVMAYQLDEELLGGLQEFQKRLLANGFGDAIHFPRIVSALGAATAGSF